MTHGDQIEQETWNLLRPCFQRYESFWLTHVYPLRCKGSIYLRRGLDERFEELAMCHYTTYVNLARARQKIESRSEDFKFCEEIYANLQRAAEVAIKTVTAFRTIYQECLGRGPKVNDAPIGRIAESFKIYRNLLHDPILATAKDADTRFIPCRDKMDKYHRWTAVMYERDERDFVPVEKQLWSDWLALCSALQTTWRDMEEASSELLKNSKYVERRDKGDSPSQVFSSDFSDFTSTSATFVSGSLSVTKKPEPDGSR